MLLQILYIDFFVECVFSSFGLFAGVALLGPMV
jgi:hypothetical protein